jgi:hypothetical protein
MEENAERRTPNAQCREVHVIPVNDDRAHSAEESCACHPWKAEDGVLVHNAWDCREKWERLGFIRNGKPWAVYRNTVLLSEHEHEQE